MKARRRGRVKLHVSPAASLSAHRVVVVVDGSMKLEEWRAQRVVDAQPNDVLARLRTRYHLQTNGSPLRVNYGGFPVRRQQKPRACRRVRWQRLCQASRHAPPTDTRPDAASLQRIQCERHLSIEANTLAACRQAILVDFTAARPGDCRDEHDRVNAHVKSVSRGGILGTSRSGSEQIGCFATSVERWAPSGPSELPMACPLPK